MSKQKSTAMPRPVETAAAPYPPPGPVGDLMAVEALLDLLRIAVEKDFVAGRLECRQESAAVAAGHALYLARRARLSVAEALANHHIYARG